MINEMIRKSKEFENAQLQKAIRRSIMEEKEKGMKETFDPKKELVPESEEKKELRKIDDLKEIVEQEKIRHEMQQRMELSDRRQHVSGLCEKIEDLIAQKEKDRKKEEEKRNSILSLLSGFNQATSIVGMTMELNEETEKEILEERKRMEYSLGDCNHRVVIAVAKIEAMREVLYLIEDEIQVVSSGK